MLLTTNKLSARSALPRSATPSLPLTACHARRVITSATKNDCNQDVSKRELLATLAIIGSFTVVQSVQAATDPYEELKSITAARTGSSSLLESFGAVSTAKADRGIRERLAAEATASQPPSTNTTSSSSSGFKFSLSTPKPSAPSLFSAAPEPQPPKPAAAAAAAKPAAAAPAAAGAGAFAPLLQAAGVLGLVGIGATAVTNFATSNKKGSKPKPASSAPAAAAAAPPAAAASSTSKVSATKKVTRSATTKVTAGGGAAASKTRKIVNKVPTAAAAASGTVKGTLKQVLVNEEKPEEPTDFAVAGFLGFAAVLGAFFLFGLPQPQVVQPPSSPEANDVLVQLAKENAKASSSTYSTPLFKSLAEKNEAESERKVVVAAKSAPEIAAPAAAAAKGEAAAVVKSEAVKVEAPKAPAAPVAATSAAPAAAEKPKVVTPEPAAASTTAAAEQQQQQGANPVVLGLAGLGIVVAAFAFTGSSSGGGGTESASSNGAATSTATSAAGEGPAAAQADGSVAAETVSAAASTAAASAPAQGATGDNAAYEKAVNALYLDPDTADDLYSIIQPALRNPPALAWALISNGTNVETLDGWAFQKLSKARYERVRALLVNMGLQLPDSPKPQPVFNMTTAAGAAELDPEKLRRVFEALLANTASRSLMKNLLSGAGMPFNEEAFEEQIKDSTYFNLAIAPILRKMPPQKLAVLADLQDPAKLQELVRSVSNLAADNTQLEAVTAELSGDVRSTVEKIRETESSSTTTAASR